jgi:integrase
MVAIGKPRGAKQLRPVYCYLPKGCEYTTPTGKHYVGPCKVYVGSRKNLRGEDGAKALETQKTIEFARKDPTTGLTVAQYAQEWLEHHHGPGTRRPAPSTLKVNAGNLRPFLKEFSSRPLDGGIPRREALAWSRQHPHNAVVVCAMFNDALDDETARTNPFAGRRMKESRERKHIHPLTEDEVDRLADIALRHWGGDGYGLVARAWVLFGAWVGSRPGETFGVTAGDLDFGAGEVTVRRVKRRGGEHPVDVVVLPGAAVDAIRAMPVIPARGPLFTTVTGRPMVKGNLVHHWDPVRAAFRETVSEARWHELLDDVTESGERRHERSLAFYALTAHVRERDG